MRIIVRRKQILWNDFKGLARDERKIRTSLQTPLAILAEPIGIQIGEIITPASERDAFVLAVEKRLAEFTDQGYIGSAAVQQ